MRRNLMPQNGTALLLFESSQHRSIPSSKYCNLLICHGGVCSTALLPSRLFDSLVERFNMVWLAFPWFRFWLSLVRKPPRPPPPFQSLFALPSPLFRSRLRSERKCLKAYIVGLVWGRTGGGRGWKGGKAVGIGVAGRGQVGKWGKFPAADKLWLGGFVRNMTQYTSHNSRCLIWDLSRFRQACCLLNSCLRRLRKVLNIALLWVA